MLLLHHAGLGIPGEIRTRICLLGGGGSISVKLQGQQNGGAPGICTPDTLAGATVFRTASSTKPDVVQNGSPTWTRTTTIRLTGGHAAFTSSGILPAPGLAPGTSAVRSGACSISYTLRALIIGRAPRLRSGYLAGPSGADCYLPRARTLDVPDKWRPVRALLPPRRRKGTWRLACGRADLPLDRRLLFVAEPTGHETGGLCR